VNPTMIQIGPLRIQWYGFLLTLAIFIGFELAKRRLKAWGFDPEKFETVAFFAVVFGVVGARLGYVLTSPGYFLENPVEILYIWHGGLSFHGAILGGALVFLYYHKKKGYPLWPYLDAAHPGGGPGHHRRAHWQPHERLGHRGPPHHFAHRLHLAGVGQGLPRDLPRH
jgi:phosphatidylglycerol:prolipoprotein diacylglycerol transferase